MSERLGPNIVDLAAYRQKRDQVFDAFSGLPVAEGVNLANFRSIVQGQDPGQLKEKVASRYENLCKTREAAGIEDKLILGNELIVSILDDGLYDELNKEAEEDILRISVARHEGGHGVVAAVCGWHVASMTNVPNGYYLGLTECIPPAGLRFDRWLLQSAAISYGGKIAAIMSGDKPSGIGADMASARAKARIAVSLPWSGFSSEEAFLREAESMAHRAISRFGVSNLNKLANIVFEKGTMAA